MSIKHELRKLLWKVGYDISRFTPASSPIARRKKILETYQVDTVLDVGANTGQFAQELIQDLGYTGRILSFEPLSSAFKMLQANSRLHPQWEVFNHALGDATEKRRINIAGNSQSSSLLEMLPSHLESAPDSRYVGTETIEIRTLDSMFAHLCGTAAGVCLKIDAQGFESNILRGAARSLPRIDTVQMEMSLVPLYEGELLFNEMCLLMSNGGYTLIAIEPGLSDPGSGQLLQMDGIFHRFSS